MARLNSENQAKRRQQIIDYIKEHSAPVRSGEICSALGLSRSSLSDDINAINAQRQIILSPTRGYYTISDSLEPFQVAEEITKKYIRRWLILAILSSKEQSFESLLNALHESWGPCNRNTLYADLQELKKEDLVHQNTFRNRVFYHSHALFFAGHQEILNYMEARKKRTMGSKVKIKAYERIDLKIKRISADTESISSSKSNIRRTGKLNIVSDKQIKLLDHFCSFPFRDNALTLQFHSKRGTRLECQFSTGMIVYSVETNRIYLFGKDALKRLMIIPLDRVIPESIRVEKKKYNYCVPKEFAQIYEEMLNVSAAEPVSVRVRFQNLPFVRVKVERMHQLRKYSSLKIINNGEDLLYTDTVRGLEDFARYLRKFGRSVIVEEPKELRDQMINTSRLVISLYEEEFGDVKARNGSL